LRIGITDSGVGGLSVCAEVEARLRQSPVQEDIELIYLNAAIEGIVHSGIREMLAVYEHESDTSLIIYATPTTIEEGVYGNALSGYIGERPPITLSALKTFTHLPGLCGEL
jgi:glutamate racemase